jgi:hypothetical protein
MGQIRGMILVLFVCMHGCASQGPKAAPVPLKPIAELELSSAMGLWWDESIIAALSSDSIHVLDRASKQREQVLLNADGAQAMVGRGQNGFWFRTRSGLLASYDVRKNEVHRGRQILDSQVVYVCPVRDGRNAFVATSGGELAEVVWPEGSIVWRRKTAGTIVAAAMGVSGSRIAYCDGTSLISEEYQTGANRRVLRDASGCGPIAISADDEMIAVVVPGEFVTLFSRGSPSVVEGFDAAGRRIASVQLRPTPRGTLRDDAQYVAFVGESRFVYTVSGAGVGVVDLNSDRLVATSVGDPSSPTTVPEAAALGRCGMELAVPSGGKSSVFRFPEATPSPR